MNQSSASSAGKVTSVRPPARRPPPAEHLETFLRLRRMPTPLVAALIPPPPRAAPYGFSIPWPSGHVSIDLAGGMACVVLSRLQARPRAPLRRRAIGPATTLLPKLSGPSGGQVEPLHFRATITYAVGDTRECPGHQQVPTGRRNPTFDPGPVQAKALEVIGPQPKPQPA